LMTAVISLLVIGAVPGQLKLIALGLALIAALLLSLAEDVPTEPAAQR